MPEGIEEQAPAEQGGGNETAKVFNDVGNGLAVITDAVLKSQAPDELKGAMKQVMDDYIAVSQQLMGGGAPAGGTQPAEQQGTPLSQAGV